MKTALAITHVAFEDLGTLEDELLHAGYTIERLDACTADLSGVEPGAHDLVVVLGGPVGAYEQQHYPFIATEIAWLRTRLAQKRATLGICLGSQLMAAALGARVYPGQHGKEIGWKPLRPGRDAGGPAATDLLVAAGLPVLHWHGDTFDLPEGARHLASTDQYAHQAFSFGRFALGLQFHPEVTAQGLERWYVGHACELAQARIDVATLRQAGMRHALALAVAAQSFWRAWLAEVALGGCAEPAPGPVSG